MELKYKNKKSEKEILGAVQKVELLSAESVESKNLLIHADNIIGLHYLLANRTLAGKIDLVYIDPPFASNNVFTITEDRANTISSSASGTIAYKDDIKGADFIEFLRERLILLKALLSDEGSIYLHIDYKIGHYVKIVMDEIFGTGNFRNDITRVKCNPKNFARKGYGNIKDLILFYSKSDKLIWNEPKMAYTDADRLKLFPKVDKKGRHYTTIPIHAPGETKNGKTGELFRGIAPPKGRHWRSNVKELEKLDKEGLIEWSENGNPRKKIYFDEQEGKRIQDIWEFKDPQYPVYPTEKNPDLLDLIIKTSSRENSIILDCFCGSGTTLKAAQKNNRAWIGIDESDEAIKAVVDKMAVSESDLFSNENSFQLLREKENTTKIAHAS